jgi:hypothetical protein
MIVLKSVTFVLWLPAGPAYIKDLYVEFIAAQVKTLSFLAYTIGRGFVALLLFLDC